MGTLQLILPDGEHPILHPSLSGAGQPVIVTGSSSQQAGTGQTLIVHYTTAGTSFDVSLTLLYSSQTLSVQLSSNKPLLSSIDLGNWDTGLDTTPVAVPYLSTPVHYSAPLDRFLNTWWDWHNSMATQNAGTMLNYQPRTDGSRNSANEIFYVSSSSTLNDVLPVIDNPPSPFIKAVSGRVVLDVWDFNGFNDVASGLQLLSQYGVNNCIVLIHVWQHQGYDNGLPGAYPANTQLGGDSSLQSAIQSGKLANCMAALHQNYLDYYRDYPDFSTNAVAEQSNGQLLPALTGNSYSDAYLTKPSMMTTNASQQSPLIHSSYATNAIFLDCNSAISPWDQTDFDVHVENAGTSQLWMKGTSQLWNYERTVESGPVFGEGRLHWYYSGLLDGVEAQFGAGIAQQQGPSVPLLVDFDLLRIHPLQVNHGMGYFERWNQEATTAMTSTELDAYRMQEIAFGHAPFVGTAYWNDLPHVLTEYGLISPVAQIYGSDQVQSILYQVKDNWVTSSDAAKAGGFSRVQVQYHGGLNIVANAQTDTLNWNAIKIPQYGWAAKGDNILAYSALCGTTLCDYAETPNSVFANSRNQLDMQSGNAVATASVSSFQQTGVGQFSLHLKWTDLQHMTSDYSSFVFVVNDNDQTENAGILAGSNIQPAQPTSQWQVGSETDEVVAPLRLPQNLPDGNYSVRVGLFSPQTGSRLPLDGQNDGQLRYLVGTIHVQNGGNIILFSPPSLPAPDPRMNAAGAVVSFPALSTDGMVRITRENNEWVLRPFPVGKPFTVLMNESRFPMPAAVAVDSTHAAVQPIQTKGGWLLPLNGSMTYRWLAN